LKRISHTGARITNNEAHFGFKYEQFDRLVALEVRRLKREGDGVNENHALALTPAADG
jgi:hypothetical protein